MTTDPSRCREADLLVLPGSRATVSDLAWLRSRGLDAVVDERVREGRPVLGICGGYEMLLESIDDSLESGDGVTPGLGHLPGVVHFAADKVLARPHSTWQGNAVSGYEIHHGIVEGVVDEVVGDDGSFPGGSVRGPVWGTIWHGTLENDAFRRAWLAVVAQQSGSTWTPRPGPGFADRRTAMIDTLADAVEHHLDLDRLLDLARRESHDR